MIKTLAYLIGTGFGSGLSPVAPGTAGSILAIVIFFFIPLNSWIWLIIVLIIFFIGVWSAGTLENFTGKQDPGMVVVDEMAGQWISFLFLPQNYITFIGGFVLFRIFDIFKPYPINKSQQLKGGWGIMIDDVLAGIYANVALQFLYMTGLLN